MNEDRPISKSQLIQDEVDEIFTQLQEEHDSQYTPAQYRLWANNIMIQVGTHKHYDTPPIMFQCLESQQRLGHLRELI